jgi:hypothetical protein
MKQTITATRCIITRRQKERLHPWTSTVLLAASFIHILPSSRLPPVVLRSYSPSTPLSFPPNEEGQKGMGLVRLRARNNRKVKPGAQALIHLRLDCSFFLKISRPVGKTHPPTHALAYYNTKTINRSIAHGVFAVSCKTNHPPPPNIARVTQDTRM